MKWILCLLFGHMGSNYVDHGHHAWRCHRCRYRVVFDLPDPRE